MSSDSAGQYFGVFSNDTMTSAWHLDTNEEVPFLSLLKEALSSNDSSIVPIDGPQNATNPFFHQACVYHESGCDPHGSAGCMSWDDKPFSVEGRGFNNETSFDVDLKKLGKLLNIVCQSFKPTDLDSWYGMVIALSTLAFIVGACLCYFKYEKRETRLDHQPLNQVTEQVEELDPDLEALLLSN